MSLLESSAARIFKTRKSAGGRVVCLNIATCERRAGGSASAAFGSTGHGRARARWRRSRCNCARSRLAAARRPRVVMTPRPLSTIEEATDGN
eukprot:30087-Pelagococcus_subviridis.AAC.25